MTRAMIDCPACEGTGISRTGPADAACGRCHGRGYLLEEVDEDEEDALEEPAE